MNKTEQIHLLQKVFIDVPPFIIQYALENQDVLQDGFIPFLKFWELKSDYHGEINKINMGILPSTKKEAFIYLDETLKVWLSLWGNRF